MTRWQTTLAGVLVLFLLAGCSEEQLDEIQSNIDNDLYPDKNFASVINFPTTPGTTCPDWKANSTVTLRQSTTLPANCSFQRVTLVIDRPNVELNCNNAVFNAMPKIERNRYGKVYTPEEAPVRYGIIIQGNQSDTARVSDITIRNCQFLNYGDAITAQFNLPQSTLLGLRNGNILESTIQAIAPTRINVLNSKLVNSHLHGIFLNRYVSYLSVQHSQILGSGNSGIYLGADTEHALISHSVIEGNGFSSYDTDTRIRTPRRTEVSRREGIAVDASSNNRIANNTFRDNGDGGVYLYKNCWEYVEDPYTAPHRYGSNANEIDGNNFSAEETAVWVAERADRDLADFTCGDSLLVQENSRKYYRDIAQNNLINNNTFSYNKTGVRIQDDGTLLTNNTFIDTKSGPDIWVYSRIRQKAGDPVKNTTIRSNTLSKSDGILFENAAN